MSDPTPSPTDLVIASVEQVNAFNLGLAPAFALAQQYVATSQALGLQLIGQPAVQQQSATLASAATVMACAQILDVDVASLAPKAS